MAEWTGQGLRVLLFAIRHQPPDALSADELPGDLEAAGLLSFSDELRPEAQTTLSEFAAAGIRLKIISGDNPDTVAALARQAGFVEEVRPVSGDELAALSPTDFARTAEDATVFGRITPQQKEALIIALRRAGFYVAMVGDGVNDVLALKRAQLAIALQSGSQAARSIADIVLMRDSFGVLPAMFREGQRIIRGMLHIMRLFLVRTLYVMLIIGGTALLNVAFPVTPRQNALLAILTVGIPTLALAAWAKPGPPRGSAILSTSRFVVPSALTATAFLLPLYVLYARLGHDVELARTVLTIAAALCGLLLILFVEPPSPFWVGGEELNGSLRPVVLAGAMLVLLGTILAVPVLRQGFELTTIRAVDLVIIEIVVVAYLFAVRWVWRARLFERFFGLVEEP
jgi:cation-transporting ATPase E